MSLDRSGPVDVAPSGSTPIDTATMADGSKRQITALGSGDSAGGALVVAVATSQPSGTENGLIVREAQKGQDTMANSRPVVIASDQTELIFNTPELTSVINLNAANANVVLNVSGRRAFGMVITAIGTAHLQMQGSINGSNWVAFDLWNESSELWQTGDITATGSYWAEAVGPITQIRVIQISGTGPATGTLIAGNQPSQHAEYAGNPAGAVPPVVAFVGGTDGSGNLRGLSTDSSGVVNTHSVPQTSGGLTVSRFLSAASTNATNVKSSAGQVYGWSFQNNTGTARFVKLYNKASSPTVGTDTPFLTLMVPPNSGNNLLGEIGIPFSLGISVAITANPADSDTTVVGSNDIIFNLFYK